MVAAQGTCFTARGSSVSHADAALTERHRFEAGASDPSWTDELTGLHRYVSPGAPQCTKAVSLQPPGVLSGSSRKVEMTTANAGPVPGAGARPVTAGQGAWERPAGRLSQPARTQHPGRDPDPRIRLRADGDVPLACPRGGQRRGDRGGIVANRAGPLSGTRRRRWSPSARTEVPQARVTTAAAQKPISSLLVESYHNCAASTD